MSAGDNELPTIPGVFIGQSDGDAIKANQGLPVSADSIYDGWGYFHVINNTNEPIVSPVGGLGSGDTELVQPGHELGYYAPAQTVEEINPDTGEPYGTDFGDLTMHNIEVDPNTQGVTPSFDAGPRMFISWYSLGMRALEYRPGHYHTNSNDEGSYSQNVHEVGRWIDPAGSNFWGVHVDYMEIDGENTQVVVASDRNLGLYIFEFTCDDAPGPFYCTQGVDP